MADRGFLARHGIARSAIKQDLLFFAIPALVLFALGLFASEADGGLAIWSHVWDLLRSPSEVRDLSAARASGLVIFFSGIGFATLAQVTLRLNYAPTVVIFEDHQLITHGVYRVVRHPLYLGVLVAMNGLPIYASSGVGHVFMAALIPLFLFRIRLEERLLAEVFGEAWETYRQRTPKIVPLLY